MVGETNAAIEGALAGRRDRHPRQRQPLEHVQPAARADLHPGGAGPPGPEGVVDGRRRPAGPTANPASTSRCSSAITRGPGIRAARSPTRIPASRSRRGSTAGRPASTGSTRSPSARGASRSGWSPATTRSPRRSRPGCPGPSGSSSRRPTAAAARSRVHPTVARERVRAGAERAVRRAAAGRAADRSTVGAAGRHRGRLRARRGRRLRGDRARAPSGSATAACATPSRRSRSPRSAASSPVVRLAGHRRVSRTGLDSGNRGDRWADRPARRTGRDARRGVGRPGARRRPPSARSARSCACSASTGLDRSGRPLAGAAVDRWLAGVARRPRRRDRPAVRDGAARIRPRAAAARARRRVGRGRPRARGRAPARARRRAPPETEATPPGGRRDRTDRCRPDRAARAHRPARRGATGRGSGRRSPSPTSTGRSTRPPSWPSPASTCCGSRSRSGASSPSACTTPASTCPSGTRAIARRPAADRRRTARRATRPRPAASARSPGCAASRDGVAAERRGYVRLATAIPPLGVPEGAVVAAFERVDLVEADPDRRDRRSAASIPTARSPITRSRDGSIAAPTRSSRSGRGRSSSRRTSPPACRPMPRHARVGRSRCSSRRRAGPRGRSRRRNGSSSGRIPPGWPTSRRRTARILGEVAVRRALFPGHVIRFDEPSRSPGCRCSSGGVAVHRCGGAWRGRASGRRHAPRPGPDGRRAAIAGRAPPRGSQPSSPRLDRPARSRASPPITRAPWWPPRSTTLERLADRAGGRWSASRRPVARADGGRRRATAIGGDAVAERTEAFDPFDAGASGPAEAGADARAGRTAP